MDNRIEFDGRSYIVEDFDGYIYRDGHDARLSEKQICALVRLAWKRFPDAHCSRTEGYFCFVEDEAGNLF